MSFAQPKVMSFAQPKVMSFAQPKVMSFAQPKVMSFAQPKVMSFAQPKVMSFAQPKVMSFAQPKVMGKAHIDMHKGKFNMQNKQTQNLETENDVLVYEIESRTNFTFPSINKFTFRNRNGQEVVTDDYKHQTIVRGKNTIKILRKHESKLLSMVESHPQDYLKYKAEFEADWQARNMDKKTAHEKSEYNRNYNGIHRFNVVHRRDPKEILSIKFVMNEGPVNKEELAELEEKQKINAVLRTLLNPSEKDDQIKSLKSEIDELKAMIVSMNKPQSSKPKTK